MLTILSGCVISIGLLLKPLSFLNFIVNFNFIINFLIKFATRITIVLGQIARYRPKSKKKKRGPKSARLTRLKDEVKQK